MNDAQSTVVGLRAQDCPGGWHGEQREPVADCLASGSCGCIYGDAVKHIEGLQAALTQCGAEWSSSSGTVMGAAAELGREFKRRMQLAADALHGEQSADGVTK